MGRDEHKTTAGKNPLAQTPKSEKQDRIDFSDGIDVEFSRELADAEDLEAKRRSEQADNRVKRGQDKSI